MTISANPHSNGILLCITSLVPDPLPDFKGEALGTRIVWACFFGRVRPKKSKVRSMGWRISFSFPFIIHLFDFGTEECHILVASLALCYDPKLQPNPRREGSPCNSLYGEANSAKKGYLFQG